MKTFLIIIGCIFLYILMTFITFTLILYCDRCNLGPSAYEDAGGNIVVALFWPIAIWFVLGYLLYLKLKKYAVAITEILYQINHKEREDGANEKTSD